MKANYDVMHKNFENRYNLENTGPDSFVYYIKHDDIYECMKQNRKHCDISESVNDHVRDYMNDKVHKKFQDETQSLPIVDFIALNPK